MKHIQIPFKCRCMTEEAIAYVRERRCGENISDWLREVQYALGRSHAMISPECKADKLEHAKIPLGDNKPIGEAP